MFSMGQHVLLDGRLYEVVASNEDASLMIAVDVYGVTHTFTKEQIDEMVLAEGGQCL